jgi:uncharacterized membrane protein
MRLYQSALAAYQVPDDRLGVPALCVGDTLLVGSREIPEQLPGIVDAALQNTGLVWSQIPGLDGALASGEYVTFEGQAPLSASRISAAPAQEPGTPTWLARFQRDPVGNGIAVAILILMVIVVVTSAYSFLTAAPAEIDEDENATPVAVSRPSQDWRRWAILLLALAGLGVATYMSYVELSQRDAICGPIGDCNAVQKSPYAVLFGVLHVGVFGMIGYAAILVAQLVAWLGPASLRKLATLAVWVLAFFGLLFTIYLTFLEPFVIGATCIWCISSALIMTALFWVSTQPAKDVMSE